MPREILERFLTYYKTGRSWKSLSLVLEEFNTEDKTVQHCLKLAVTRGDSEGEKLAGVLLMLPRALRRKISYSVEESLMLN